MHPSCTLHPPQTAADTKYVDYTAKKAFLFPGQGAQSVGMAKVCVFVCVQGINRIAIITPQELCAELPAAKELFDKAADILGYDLLALCSEGARKLACKNVCQHTLPGPKEKLDTTAISQPAIYVASLAAVEKLRAEGGDVRIPVHVP